VEQFIESCFSWPSWPASVLLLCVCVYWVLMIVGAVDLDFLDIDVDLDLDIDVDADPSILEFGFVPLKFLNIGSVPTMVWGSIFALVCWMVSRLWNSPLPHPSFEWTSDSLAIMRDFGVAAMLTKMITQPMRGRFDPVEPNKAEDLIGQTCIVTTSEVTETFGEAEFATEGAPLRLNVRNGKGDISKGDTVLITYFRNETNEYLVERM
jgi:hypothetical protein